jgi:aminotransferase in exopolysaccharide biosynthesis
MIPLSVPNLKGNELRYLKECVKTEYVSSVGKYVSLFEKKICKFTNSKYAVACASGTAALQLALRVVGVKENDEVIIPTMSFIATANAAIYLKAKPIFMDCDNYYNLDVKKLILFLKNNTFFKNRFTFNKKTKRKITAIMPVHVSGNAADLFSLVRLCKKKKIKIVEDAAEAVGTFYSRNNFKQKHAGTIGDVGCLSFNGNKIITSGGGGMILTNDMKLARKAKYLSTQATDDSVRYIHNDIGYNYRLTNIQAAVGLAQLEKINLFLKKKKKIYEFYKKKIKLIKGLSIPERPSYAKNNNWMMSIIIDKKKYGMNKDKLINLLKKKYIQSRSMWLPIHLQKEYRNFERYKISNAIKLFKNSINIPCSTNLTSEQASQVIKVLKDK